MDVIEFATLSISEGGPSKYNVWPTRDAPTRRKFNSIWMELDQEQDLIERSTYGLLDFVGDLGGLWDGLEKSASFFVSPIAVFAMKENLLAAFFWLSKKNKSEEEASESPVQRFYARRSIQKAHVEKAFDRAERGLFGMLEKIAPQGFVRTCLKKNCSKSRYGRFLDRAEDQIVR